MRTACALGLLLLISGCSTFVSKTKYDDLEQKLSETSKQLTDAKEELQKAREKIGEYQGH